MARENDRDEYLIRTTVGKDDWVHKDELYRLIEYLGGVRSDDGFVFPTQERRSVALDLIAEKYGNRYVTAVD
jgi:hypothetical protein